jgi:hypothetical protein
VYYLTIPCMYMLLPLYCVFNLEIQINFDPQETHYLVYGIVYYLTIPCMYMLLPLYCVFKNLILTPRRRTTWCTGLCTT